MDQLDLAVHNTAHRTKDHAEFLAKSMGKGYQVFINKCNYNNEVNHLTLAEARAMMILSNDFQILDALERDRPTHTKPTQNLSEALLHLGVELGEVYTAIAKAKEDNRVTEREKSTIYREIADVRKALNIIEASISEL